MLFRLAVERSGNVLTISTTSGLRRHIRASARSKAFCGYKSIKSVRWIVEPRIECAEPPALIMWYTGHGKWKGIALASVKQPAGSSHGLKSNFIIVHTQTRRLVKWGRVECRLSLAGYVLIFWWKQHYWTVWLWWVWLSECTCIGHNIILYKNMCPGKRLPTAITSLSTNICRSCSPSAFTCSCINWETEKLPDCTSPPVYNYNSIKFYICTEISWELRPYCMSTLYFYL